MNNLFGYLRSGLAVLAAAGLMACITPERKAARRIDLTPEIVQQASDLIAADAELGRFPIGVDGFKGDMRLKGRVATPAQKERAAKLVWAIRGVKSVENDLEIQGPGGSR